MKQDTSISDPLVTIQRLSPIECGEEAATHFLFDEGYINLNHGTNHTLPFVRAIALLTIFQARTELTRERYNLFFATIKKGPKLDLMLS